jgi:hypothetical protein
MPTVVDEELTSAVTARIQKDNEKPHYSQMPPGSDQSRTMQTNVQE